MARIFMTGFEAGSIYVCDWIRDSPDIKTTTVRTGANSVYVGSSEGIGNSLSGSPAEAYFRIGHYYSGASYFASVFFSLYDRDGANQLTFMYNKSTNLIEVRRGDQAGTLLATGSIACPVGSWYLHEIHVVIDDSVGVVQTKVNGVSDIDISSQDTQTSAYAEMTKFLLGLDGINKNALGYYDDIAINDTTGPINNSWIGRGGIHGLKPNAAGQYTQFTPSAGDNYAAVDEVPPDDDTTYVESDTVGHKDTYALEDLVPVSGDIQAVQWIARAKLAEAGEGNFQRLIRHDSVDYNGGDLAVDTSYAYFTEIIEKAPDGTDWTIAKVNALEAGMEVS